MPSDAQDAAQRPPLWAILGTVVFTIVVPGTFVVVVPYLLSGWRFDPPIFGWTATRAVGAALAIAAMPTFVGFLYRFVQEGHGTPAPIAPPQRLVTGGTFQRVRNPAYISVVAMILGQGLFLGNTGVLIYAAVVAAGFHLFVVLYEEPTLRSRFGADYEQYCRQVPRWIPRLAPASSREDRKPN